MIKRASEFDREVIPNFCGGAGDTVIETGIHGGERQCDYIEKHRRNCTARGRFP